MEESSLASTGAGKCAKALKCVKEPCRMAVVCKEANRFWLSGVALAYIQSTQSNLIHIIYRLRNQLNRTATPCTIEVALDED